MLKKQSCLTQIITGDQVINGDEAVAGLVFVNSGVCRPHYSKDVFVSARCSCVLPQ